MDENYHNYDSEIFFNDIFSGTVGDRFYGDDFLVKRLCAGLKMSCRFWVKNWLFYDNKRQYLLLVEKENQSHEFSLIFTHFSMFSCLNLIQNSQKTIKINLNVL